MEQSNTIIHLLAQNIHNARLALHMTQQELAEKTNLTTLSVSNIERAATWPKSETIDALAAALHKRPYELFLDEAFDSVISKNTFNDEINMLIKELTTHQQRFNESKTASDEHFSIIHSARQTS